MDPISALSLACNVVQLVDFSIESVKICKELYDSGSIDDNNRIEKYTAEITAANKDLKAALASGKPGSRPSRIERVAQDALGTASELKIALERLKLSKAQGIRRLGGAFKSTLKTLISSGKIRKLQQRLELQDAALRSSILKDLYIKAGQNDLAQKKGFQNLSQGQKDLVVQILEDRRLLSTELTDSIKSSEAKITARLSAQDAQLDESSRKNDLQMTILRKEEFNVCKRRLLKALAFPEINERRNMIEGRVDDFGDTYKWIFNATYTEYARPVVSPSNSVVSEDSVSHDDQEEMLVDPEEKGQNVLGMTTSDLERQATPATRQNYNDSPGQIHSSPLPLTSPVKNNQVAADRQVREDNTDIAPGSTSTTIDPSGINTSGTQQLDEEQNISSSGTGSLGSGVSENQVDTNLHRYPRKNAFVNWLESGTNLFWISGKPSSGKSTLMDYIYHGLQPENTGSGILKSWAGSRPVAILTFWFFRPASTPLLKTLHGFWRSLCFQILDTDPNLAKTIRNDEDGTAPSSLRSCLLPDGSNAESWTDNELRLWFWYMVEHSHLRFCLLIDGLDEIESNRELLLDTVSIMSIRSDKLKVCCACRPENPFQNVLKHHPNLRLQDLNKGDIKKDCKRRVKGTNAENFTDEIARRAEGVFLWAHLISVDLARAAKEGESEEDLSLRLKDCPDEMTELFKYMIKRQDKLYAKRRKPYLQLVDFASSRGQQTTLLELLIATLPTARSPKWSELSGKFDVDFLSYLEEQLDGLGSRIENTCTGLVQCLAPIWSHRYGTPMRSKPTLLKLNNAVETPVVFIHRSVQDFLREDEGGAAYYERFKLTDDEAASMLIAGAASPLFLSEEKLDSPPTELWPPLNYAKFLSRASWDTKTIAVIDAFFKQLELRSSPTQADDMVYYHGLRTVSLDLSLRENLSIGLSLRHGLDTYVLCKILEVEPKRRHLLAAHALCTYLRHAWSRCRGEMVTALSPYIDGLQVHSSMYPQYYDELDVVSTCSLINHVVVARIHNMPERHDHELDYLRLPSGFLDPHAGTDLESGSVEGWILYNLDGYSSPTFPPPDDDCAYMRNSFENTTVAVFHILPQDILRTDIFPLKFVRWSPAGTRQFFPINGAVQQKFRRSHSRKSWGILRQEFNAALVEGLNSPSNDMSEKEFEQIKTRNERGLTVDEDNKFEINGSFILGRFTGFSTKNLPFMLRDEDDDKDEQGLDAEWTVSRPITPLKDLAPSTSSTPSMELEQRLKTSSRAESVSGGE